MLHILKRIRDLKHYTFRAKDGNIGGLREVYFDDVSWTVRYLVVNAGTWLRGRMVLLTPQSIGAIKEEEGILPVELTKQQVEASPPIDARKPLSRQQEVEYHKHYSWLDYWRTGLFSSSAEPSESSVQSPTKEEAIDPHLRSSAEVTGYHIETRDGEIGYVEDFIVDEQDWTVRYLEVNTQAGLFGKKILVAPAWIEQMNWKESKVHVDLLREAIRLAPEYKEDQVIGRDYEIELYEHYGRSQYWK